MCDYEDEIQERIRYYEEKKADELWGSSRWFNRKDSLRDQFISLILKHHIKGVNQIEDDILEEYSKLKKM